MKFVILGSHAFSFLTEEKNQLRQILNLDGGPNFNAIDFKQFFPRPLLYFHETVGSRPNLKVVSKTGGVRSNVSV